MDKEFKPMKELVNALWAIVKAIRGENGGDGGEGEQNNATWLDAAKTFVKEGPVPVGIIVNLGDGDTYKFFKDYPVTYRFQDLDNSMSEINTTPFYEESVKDFGIERYILSQINFLNGDYDGNRSFGLSNYGVIEVPFLIEGKTYYYYQDTD